jgi:hypothetical protein
MWRSRRRELGVKRLELLHELAPKGAAIAVLLHPNYPEGGSELPAVEAAARGFGRPVMVVRTESARDFEAAFAGIVRAVAGAILVNGSPFFTSQRKALIALAARHAIPASYDLRDYVEEGGLISYGASIAGPIDRQAPMLARSSTVRTLPNCRSRGQPSLKWPSTLGRPKRLPSTFLTCSWPALTR